MGVDKHKGFTFLFEGDASLLTGCIFYAGSFRVGIDFVTRSLAIPKLGMAKIQVYNAKV